MLFVSLLKTTEIPPLDEIGNYNDANMNHKYDDYYFFKFLKMSTNNELITLFKSTQDFIQINETGKTAPTSKNDHKKETE